MDVSVNVGNLSRQEVLAELKSTNPGWDEAKEKSTNAKRCALRIMKNALKLRRRNAHPIHGYKRLIFCIRPCFGMPLPGLGPSFTAPLQVPYQ